MEFIKEIIFVVFKKEFQKKMAKQYCEPHPPQLLITVNCYNF